MEREMFENIEEVRDHLKKMFGYDNLDLSAKDMMAIIAASKMLKELKEYKEDEKWRMT